MMNLIKVVLIISYIGEKVVKSKMGVVGDHNYAMAAYITMYNTANILLFNTVTSPSYVQYIVFILLYFYIYLNIVFDLFHFLKDFIF